ncbi:hypothetical protein M5D96_000685 [Drosophila gunungcola]|uniref:Uncharacterized protein n=1 Tax=Drosophila gunungcola TaxID=103775 RepID=A0A9P9YWQ4_9MUSC|nr:hypothetical protein M5D96_000685 [Drosophila gunungcola]
MGTKLLLVLVLVLLLLLILILTGMWHSLTSVPLPTLILPALIAITIVIRIPINCVLWILDAGYWSLILRPVSCCPAFAQWFDLENPEEVACPGDYNIKCNAFQASI